MKRHTLESIELLKCSVMSSPLYGISWQLHSNILPVATSNSHAFVDFYLMLIIYSWTPELFALKILSAFPIGNQTVRLQTLAQSRHAAFSQFLASFCAKMGVVKRFENPL